MENKVSIIVPIYNVENFLEKSINSLINQTYYDIEIILIDDGSTDRSSKIIDEYAIKDSRIIAIHKKNTGVSDTRNVGLSKVSGKYITFIDADDYVEKDYIEEVMKVLKKYKNLDLVNVGFFSEISSRRYIERTFGCVQNVFIKDCKKNFKEKYKYIESIIKNEVTRECLNYMIPKSKKIKIMLIPYKYNLILLTMLMGKIFNIVKEKCPDLFNKMKNKR